MPRNKRPTRAQLAKALARQREAEALAARFSAALRRQASVRPGAAPAPQPVLTRRRILGGVVTIAGAIGLQVGGGYVAGLWCASDAYQEELKALLLEFEHATAREDVGEQLRIAERWKDAARHPEDFAKALNALAVAHYRAGAPRTALEIVAPLLATPRKFRLSAAQEEVVATTYAMGALFESQSAEEPSSAVIWRLPQIAKLSERVGESNRVALELEGWTQVHSRHEDSTVYVPPRQVVARLLVVEGDKESAMKLMLEEARHEPLAAGPAILAAFLAARDGVPESVRAEARTGLVAADIIAGGVAAHMRPLRRLAASLLDQSEALPQLDFTEQAIGPHAARYLLAGIMDVRLWFERHGHGGRARRHYAEALATAYEGASCLTPSLRRTVGRLAAG